MEGCPAHVDAQGYIALAAMGEPEKAVDLIYMPERPFDREQADHWFPIDFYVGGIEHAVGHLIYCRFWTMAMHGVGSMFRSCLARMSRPSTAFSDRIFDNGILALADIHWVF